MAESYYEQIDFVELMTDLGDDSILEDAINDIIKKRTDIGIEKFSNIVVLYDINPGTANCKEIY